MLMLLLCVNAGKQVLAAMMEADRVALCGAKNVPDAGRKAVRGGTTRSSVVLGGHLFALRHLSDSIDTQQRQLAEIDAYSGACTHVSRRQLGPL
ncbi:MAG: hypothetical protein IPO59_17060 [Betaproteobacteria bacterium]|nr:hypothetical protein [Betaproteobacteria bacterium]